jgi:PAS domain S-box-containing protein
MADRDFERTHNAGTATAASSSMSPAELLPEDKVRRLLWQPTLLSQLSDIVTVMDRQLRFLFVSRTAGGRSSSDVLGTSVLDHIAPDHREPFRAAFEAAWESGEPRVIEASSNDQMWWENRLIPVCDEDGVQFMLTTTIDTTQRVLAERAQRESENRLRHALEVSGVGTWSWREGDGRVSWDDNIARILGVGSTATTWDFEMSVQLIHEDDRARVRAHAESSISTGVYDEIEYRVLRPSGEQRHVIVRGARMEHESAMSQEWRGSMIDVTERKRYEEQLRHVHKMEAVGQLTAGIAHNFNNLLGIILPSVALCRRDATPSIHVRLDNIEHTAQRAVALVRQLMVFTRLEGSADMRSFDLCELVERTLSICRVTFDPGIAVEMRALSGPMFGFGRVGDLEQVLLNVLLNARDALSEMRIDDPRTILRLESTDGKLRLDVDDNGPGIPPELWGRVFEPFFTTKEIGKGTGLGLATAYAIIREHQGTIDVGASPLGGARITIQLPAAGRASSLV